MPRLSCDICEKDINRYYDQSLAIVEKNQRLLFMAAGHPQGAKLLCPGRVVVLRDGVCAVQMGTYWIC